MSPVQPEQTVRLSWLDKFAEPSSKVTIRFLDAEKSVSVQAGAVIHNPLIFRRFGI